MSNLVARRPAVTLAEVHGPAVFISHDPVESGVYEGRRTYLELPITDVVQFGFDVGVEEYCGPIAEIALKELLQEAGIDEDGKSEGVRIDLGEPRHDEVVYRSGVMQQERSINRRNRVLQFAQRVASDSWPTTHRLTRDQNTDDGWARLRSVRTPRLNNIWGSSEQVARNAASAVFEVFEPGFARDLANFTNGAESLK